MKILVELTMINSQNYQDPATYTNFQDHAFEMLKFLTTNER